MEKELYQSQTNKLGAKAWHYLFEEELLPTGFEAEINDQRDEISIFEDDCRESLGTEVDQEASNTFLFLGEDDET